MGEEEVGEEGEELEKQGEDERREKAIAWTPCLQPSFKPTRVTSVQLSRLQELHKRRLKMKSKTHKKLKGRTSQFHGNDSKNFGERIEDLGVPDLEEQGETCELSMRKDNVAAQKVPKKHLKLHWGLDTKERWERKANM